MSTDLIKNQLDFRGKKVPEGMFHGDEEAVFFRWQAYAIRRIGKTAKKKHKSSIILFETVINMVLKGIFPPQHR